MLVRRLQHARQALFQEVLTVASCMQLVVRRRTELSSFVVGMQLTSTLVRHLRAHRSSIIAGCVERLFCLQL